MGTNQFIYLILKHRFPPVTNYNKYKEDKSEHILNTISQRPTTTEWTLSKQICSKAMDAIARIPSTYGPFRHRSFTILTTGIDSDLTSNSKV